MKKVKAIIYVIIMFFIIYFLQSNFFTWFNIAGIMPNLYVILILFTGLFFKKKFGLAFGIILGVYLDIVSKQSIEISGIALGIIGLIAEILSKDFSKESRLTIIIMVICSTALYEIAIYTFNIITTSATLEILSFIKILSIEIFYNIIITIIIFPFIKKVGYYFENSFEDKAMLTRFY